MFPVGLLKYGLDEDVFQSANLPDIAWHLSSTPRVEFYRLLHPYLKRKHKTSAISMIGQFYINIDANLKKKGGRADNIYRFIENLVISKHLPSDAIVDYGFERKQRRKMKDLETKLQECDEKLKEVTSECYQLKKDIKLSSSQFQASENALREENHHLSTHCDKQVARLKRKCSLLQHENLQLQTDTWYLFDKEEENEEDEEEDEVLENKRDNDNGKGKQEITRYLTEQKINNRYTPEIRKLYYSLLANQVPASKIETIVKDVLRCFHPTLDVTKVDLPKRSCASYMRREELKTISNAHKATVLLMNRDKIHLNSDGTTKN